MENTVFIYALCDPDTGMVRYVGKSNKPKIRFSNHLRDKSEQHRARWIRKLKSQNKLPVLLILEEVDTISWESAEIRWIAYYRGIVGDKLTNANEGGGGTDTVSKETRQKLSMFRKGFHHTEETKKRIAEKNKGHTVSEETRNKISIKNKGNPGHVPTAEELIKISNLTRNRMANPECRRQTSERAKKQWADPKHREQFSDFNRKRWADPEFKARMKKKKEIFWSNPEMRQRQADLTRRIFSNPEVKKKLSESKKKLWSDPNKIRSLSEKCKARWVIRRQQKAQSHATLDKCDNPILSGSEGTIPTPEGFSQSDIQKL